MDIERDPSHKKRRQRQRVLLTAVVVVALILITFGISSLEPAARRVERTSLWIESVQRGEMLRAVRGHGTLVPEEIRWISAETNGQVEKIVIDPGAEVVPETVILELSDPEIRQAAQNAELELASAKAEHEDLRIRLESQILDMRANLARVKADYESALLELEANRELKESGLIPEIKLKQSELAAEQLTIRHDIEKQRLEKTHDSVDAQLSAKRTQVEQRHALFELRSGQLLSLQVRAGIRGVLQEVPVEEGQRVTPGTKLARVAQPEKLKAELRIAETQAKDIVRGQVAVIDTRNGEIQGRVSRIDPSVQGGTVTVDVTLEGELPRGARPDLSIDGTIEIERLENALYVGRPAYGQPNSTISLFRLAKEGNIATLIPVQIGRTSVKHVEIVSGLEVGDEVVLSATDQFDDAERIEVVN